MFEFFVAQAIVRDVYHTLMTIFLVSFQLEYQNEA